MKITQSDLIGFTGTMGYVRINFFGNKFLLTDGAIFLCDNGAAWLIDIIMSVFKKWKNEEFVSVKLKVKDNSGVVTLDDGNGKIIYTQKIEYTDAKFDLNLYVCNYEGSEPVIMLTSEY